MLFGSLNPASAAQVEYAKRASACRVIEAPHDLDPAATCEEIESLTSGGQVAGDLAVVSYNVPRHGPPDEMAAGEAYFASVAQRVMRGKAFSSMVLSGGDVARAVLSGLGITCMTVERSAGHRVRSGVRRRVRRRVSSPKPECRRRRRSPQDIDLMSTNGRLGR